MPPTTNQATAGLEFKAASASPESGLLEANDATGVVEAIVSVTGVLDEDHDVIKPGAYTKTLKVRRPKGIFVHDWAKWVARTDMIEEFMPGDSRLPKTTKDGQPWPKAAGGLYVKAAFNLDTQEGRDAYSNVKFFSETGECEWSVGYKVPPGKSTRTKTGERHIEEMDLFEYSPVLFGAAPLSGTLSVKSANVEAPVDTDVQEEPEEAPEDVQEAAEDTVEEAETVEEPEVDADMAEVLEALEELEEIWGGQEEGKALFNLDAPPLGDPMDVFCEFQKLSVPDIADATMRDRVQAALFRLDEAIDGGNSSQAKVEINIVLSQLRKIGNNPEVQSFIEGTAALLRRAGVAMNSPFMKSEDDEALEGKDAAGGHHVPGTPYNWRHDWHPLNAQTAAAHGKPFGDKKPSGGSSKPSSDSSPTADSGIDKGTLKRLGQWGRADGSTSPLKPSKGRLSSSSDLSVGKSGVAKDGNGDAVGRIQKVGANSFEYQHHSADAPLTIRTNKMALDALVRQQNAYAAANGGDSGKKGPDTTKPNAPSGASSAAPGARPPGKATQTSMSDVKPGDHVDMGGGKWREVTSVNVEASDNPDNPPKIRLVFKPIPGDKMTSVDDEEHATFQVIKKKDAEDGLEVKGGMAHESLNRSPKKNWVEKAGELPAYIEHIAKDIHEKNGTPLDRAIPMAIAAVKKWAAGGNGVNPDTAAKAAQAVAEWEALKAQARAGKKDAEHAGEEMLESSHYPFLPGTYEELREQIRDGATKALNDLWADVAHVEVMGTWPDYAVVTAYHADGKALSYEMPYTLSSSNDGRVWIDLEEPSQVELKVSLGGTEEDGQDLLPYPSVLEDVTVDLKALFTHSETKAGRVLSAVNEKRLLAAVESLVAVLHAAGLEVNADARSKQVDEEQNIDQQAVQYQDTTAPSARTDAGKKLLDPRLLARAYRVIGDAHAGV